MVRCGWCWEFNCNFIFKCLSGQKIMAKSSCRSWFMELWPHPFGITPSWLTRRSIRFYFGFFFHGYHWGNWWRLISKSVQKICSELKVSQNTVRNLRAMRKKKSRQSHELTDHKIRTGLESCCKNDAKTLAFLEWILCTKMDSNRKRSMQW